MDILSYILSKNYTGETAQGMGALKGEKGDKGDKGEQGIQGPQGIQGEKGEQGERGLQGVAGQDGTDGVDGVSVTVTEHGANDATTYRLEVTTKDGTIVTQNLIGRGCQWLEGTELTSTQEYTVIEIAGSCDGDYYLNKDTCHIYHRVDDTTTTNKWYYVGTLKGVEGDDAYEVAVKEGFIGTRAEWLASLVGRVELIEKVWEKPSLFSDTTELDTWYYYKVNNPDNDIALTGVEEGNAWLNRCVMVATKDYTPNNYAYYNGLRYLCFTDAATTAPALTDPSHIYYMLYNEKEQKCAACKCDLDGSNHEMITGVWVDVFESATLPDGYEEVMLTEYIQLGKWVQTVYIGNSKEFAHEVTLTTGANVQGFVTSATLSALLGEGSLKTVDQTIKGAINEHETLLRGDNNSKVLNTKEKDVFGAINEIFSRHYSNVARCEETSVRDFCDKYVIEKGTEAELTSYFFYSMGIATDVPEGNNRWGYCHCIITQDPQYKILIYYAPDLRKVFMTYSGDTGWSTEWTSNLTNEDIVTVLDGTVTDKQVVGAKALCDFISNKLNGEVINSGDLYEWASKQKENATCFCDGGVANLPINSAGGVALFYHGGGIKSMLYINHECVYKNYFNTVTWNGWKCLKYPIPDVPKTNVSSKLINATINSGGGVYYSVKNGICNVQIKSLVVSTNMNGTVIFPNGSFPKMDVDNTNGHYPVTSPNATCGLLVFNTNGTVKYYGNSMTIFATISYPVAED